MLARPRHRALHDGDARHLSRRPSERPAAVGDCHGTFCASSAWRLRPARCVAVVAASRSPAASCPGCVSPRSGTSDSITRSWTIEREIRRRHLIADPLPVVCRAARLELDERVARTRRRPRAGRWRHCREGRRAGASRARQRVRASRASGLGNRSRGTVGDPKLRGPARGLGGGADGSRARRHRGVRQRSRARLCRCGDGGAP